MCKLKIIFTVGIPASGKSTWAHEFCKQNTNFVRINRDAIRNMRGLYWFPEDEKLITILEDSCIVQSLLYGKNVVVDSTNINPQNVENKILYVQNKLKECGFTDELEIEYKHL
jgi:predicted kinase